MIGSVFIVAAPSGTGKTSLVKELLARDPAITESVSYTTRNARRGELNDRDYHFVDQDTFSKMVSDGEFLECAEVHGNMYGTRQKRIDDQRAEGTDIVLEIDWQGAQQVRKKLPDVICIFVLPPSVGVLRDRLTGRAQDSASIIERRLGAARMEVAHVHEFDYVIINDVFDEAVEDLVSIVRSTRLRLEAQLGRNKTLINSLK